MITDDSDAALITNGLAPPACSERSYGGKLGGNAANAKKRRSQGSDFKHKSPEIPALPCTLADMGFWSKLKAQAPRHQYVSVTFRSLEHIRKPIHASTEYTYSWNLAETPAPGVWVEVIGGGRAATAVIAAVNVAPKRGLKIEPVVRCLTQNELDQAWSADVEREQALAAGLSVWLDMMRSKAGLHVENELPAKPPEGYPPIPPVRGKVIGQPAYDRGRVWMRAHHRAAELGRTEDAGIFEQIAQDWYARGRKRKAS